MRFCDVWTQYLAINMNLLPPYLQGLKLCHQINLVVVFAKYVRNREISTRKYKVFSRIVAMALISISTMLQMDEKPNSLVDAQGKYPKKII